MKKMVNFEKPEKMPAKVLKNIENLKKMKDEDIDYSDIPPLDKTQLAEMVKIVSGKKRMPSITLKLPVCPCPRTPPETQPNPVAGWR